MEQRRFEPWYQLGVALQKSGDLAAAVDAYQRAVQRENKEADQQEALLLANSNQ